MRGNRVNNSLLNSNRIVTNQDYRKYLTDNATKIMSSNKLEAGNNTSFCCNNYNDKQNNSPYLFEMRENNDVPDGYENSDLKENYVNTYNLKDTLKIPVIKIEQD